MTTAVLRTEALTKAFGANVAVSEVSLSVAEGTLHTIIGPNGAGKTTLFNLLTRDIPPTSGQIFYRDEEITALPPHSIARRGIGRSYQLTSVFPAMMVAENVWIAAYRSHAGGRLAFWSLPDRYPEVAEATHAALAKVGLERVAERPAQELSYGDQRLLEIAITLAGAPRMLLFDEPTSGLSMEETGRVADLVRSLVPAYTVLMIEHNIDVVMGVSDRITVMHFGQVIAEGDPETIRTDARVRTAYLGT